MTAGTLAFVVGLYAVPLILLAGGHRLRRLTPRRRRAFWGAIVGHCVAALLALVVGMFPPESWTEASRVRGFLGLWALLLLPIVGGAVAALLPPPPHARRDAQRAGASGGTSRNQ